MTSPLTNAIKTATITAAADISLIILIRGLKSLQTISESFSIAVLKSSAVRTNPILRMMINQDAMDILITNPNIIVIKAQATSILKFLSFTNAKRSPFNA